MPKILVADTEAADRIALCDLVRGLGYGVSEAKDGSECLAAMRKNRADLVVIDLVMSDMSGWDLLEALKDRYPDVPVVVMTREIDEEGEAILTTRRADGYLIKPVIPLRTESLLNALLSGEGVGEQVDVTAVDESRETRAFLERSLAERGMYVTAFGTTTEAYRHIRNEEPDLVVVDMEAPPRSGLELCRLIRNSTDGVYTPILLLATHPRRADIEQAVRLRVNGVLTKPLDEDELGDRAVAVLLQARRRSKER